MNLWCLSILAAIVFEGALRKWLLPGVLHPLAYFAKDILAGLFILTHPFPGQTPKALRTIRNLFVAASVLLAPAFVMGLAQSPAAAALTLKNATLWPIFAVYLATNLTARTTAEVGKNLALLVCGMACLSCLQAVLPPAHFLNRYAWDAVGISSTQAMLDTGHVRVSGTFSFITGLGSFGIFAFAWSTWRLAANSGSRVLNLLAAVSSIVCILTCGSRAPLLLCGLGLFGMLLAMRRFSRVIEVCALIVIASLAVWFLPTRQFVESYLSRIGSVEDTFAERAIDPIFDFVPVVVENPLGKGLGQDSQALVYGESSASGEGTVAQFEDGRSRAAFEGGLLAIVYLLLLAIVLLGLVVRGLRAANLSIRAATGAFGFLLCWQVWQCLWFDHVTTSLAWFLAAVWMNAVATREYCIPLRPPSYRRGAGLHRKTADTPSGMLV